VKKRHRRGPLPREYCAYIQFEQLSLPDAFLSSHEPDNCIIARGRVGLIRNILSSSEESEEWFRGVPNSFFIEPLNSTNLRIFKLTSLVDNITVLDFQEITSKCALLPCRDYFVSVPLIHNFA
jgi:hypothetical protein